MAQSSVPGSLFSTPRAVLLVLQVVYLDHTEAQFEEAVGFEYVSELHVAGKVTLPLLLDSV